MAAPDLKLQQEMARKMRRWTPAKLAKELAFRDDDGGSPEGLAWCAALEAERDRRYLKGDAAKVAA